MALSFADAVMWATSLSDTRQFRHTGRDDLHHGRVEGANYQLQCRGPLAERFSGVILERSRLPHRCAI